MDWPTDTFGALEMRIWQELHTAASMLGTPFRTPALATFSGTECNARTVVLRLANRQKRSLTCYSDVRAPKVCHLRLYPKVEWLFYDSQKSIQIRLSGQTEVHHNDSVSEDEWKRVPAEHRFNYLSTTPPGADLDESDAPQLKERKTSSGSDNGYASFSVIRTTIEKIDWLRLSPDGHMRARLNWKESAWVGRWIVP